MKKLVSHYLLMSLYKEWNMKCIIFLSNIEKVRNRWGYKNIFRISELIDNSIKKQNNHPFLKKFFLYIVKCSIQIS